MTRMRTWLLTAALLAVVASAVGVALAQTSGGEAEVRISAKRLENGRTEFAIQQRTDGQWGERIQPRARYLPANPPIGRWLNSSPMTVQTEVSSSDTASNEELEAVKAALAEALAPPAIVREVGRQTYDGGRFETVVQQLENGILETFLTIRADGEYIPSIAPKLRIYCSDGSRDMRFDNLPIHPVKNEYSHLVVSYQFAPDPPNEPASYPDLKFFANASQVFGSRAWITYEARFYHLLRQSESLTIRFVGANDASLELTFTLDGVFDTPIQPNIDHCEDYY